ncbi:restriction endonuclease [Streptomyces lydicamycinicus]|uniref:restriction endonuclease n=1 Tax=Streptomyces lydicamycinicus TaxID=1546107 RepID=UPI003C3031A9
MLLALAALAGGGVVVGLVRAGQREAQGERAAEQARMQTRRSLDTVWTMDDREVEENVAELYRRNGRADIRRVGSKGELGADVTSWLSGGRKRSSASGTPNTAQSAAGTCRPSTAPPARSMEPTAAVFVALCVFTKPPRVFAAKHNLALIDIDLLGFWNSGTILPKLLDLDIGSSGSNRKLRPDG